MLQIDKLSLYIKNTCLVSATTLNSNTASSLLISGAGVCGKSLLLQAMAGKYTNYDGTITWQESLVTEKSFPAKITFLTLLPVLVPKLSFLENIIIGNKAKQASIKNAKQIIDHFQLAAIMHTPVIKLSYTEQKSCELIRALHNKTKIIFVDDIDKQITGITLSLLWQVDQLTNVAPHMLIASSQTALSTFAQRYQIIDGQLIKL